MRVVLARRLGVSPATAGRLMAEARHRLGTSSYAIRAGCFAVALVVPRPLAPRKLRRRAVLGFVGPLLHTPAALNAYAAGRDALLYEPCGGLWRGAPGGEA